MKMPSYNLKSRFLLMVNSFGITVFCMSVIGHVSLLRLMEMSGYQAFMMVLAFASFFVFVASMFIDHCDRKAENAVFLGLGVILCFCTLMAASALKYLIYTLVFFTVLAASIGLRLAWKRITGGRTVE